LVVLKKGARVIHQWGMTHEVKEKESRSKGLK
jgi:hypothetical protein